MDHHPKHIMVTCVYLACKVEEFNVSMQQFVMNIKGDRAKASDIVLQNELLLMQQLKYHLTAHNPFRPIEGFLIDIKVNRVIRENPANWCSSLSLTYCFLFLAQTRCSKVRDPERFRTHIDYFIDNCFFTDACLIYSASQVLSLRQTKIKKYKFKTCSFY